MKITKVHCIDSGFLKSSPDEAVNHSATGEGAANGRNLTEGPTLDDLCF
jgi:hypothetical protein